MEENLYFYPHFAYDQLVKMGNLYYSHQATPFQAQRYEAVRAGLLAELTELDPTTKDSGTAAYIHAAINATLDYQTRHEKELQMQGRANMQTAHNHMKNYGFAKD